ncbi:MAG: hypothetical protein ABI478_08085, partial [Propionivibrio sp.]
GCTQASLAARPINVSRLVDVTVVNRTTGERLTPYPHQGKLYIAGTPGDAYQIELRSRVGGSGGRALTVLSVDGVNVLTGETAAPLQSGYVLDGWQSYAISGWRKSMDDVAQFVFTALPDSYAARTGRPGNVGVIGVAVFREKAMPVAYSPSVSSRRAENALDEADDGAARARQDAPAPSAKAAGAVADSSEAERAEARSAPGELRQEAKKLGTGHGEREYSPTRYTEFVRAGDAPDEIITIYYDSRANLIARGVIPSPRLAEPQPFPGNAGFVPDPRG